METSRASTPTDGPHQGLVTARIGDLFTTTADAVGHGVNTEGHMGSGIALAVRAKYPAGYQEYLARTRSGQLVPGGAHLWRDPTGGQPALLNLASQDRRGPHARMIWLTASLLAGLHLLTAAGLTSLALPRIGCGIGGLDWAEVEPAITALVGEYGLIRVELWTMP